MRAKFFPPKTFEILPAASRKVNLFYLFNLQFHLLHRFMLDPHPILRILSRFPL
jgi:hypothetical protein